MLRNPVSEVLSAQLPGLVSLTPLERLNLMHSEMYKMQTYLLTKMKSVEMMMS